LLVFGGLRLACPMGIDVNSHDGAIN